MADISNYLVLESSGLAVNAIVWDGESEYAPGDGFILVEQPDGAGIGWQRNGDGSWTAPEGA